MSRRAVLLDPGGPFKRPDGARRPMAAPIGFVFAVQWISRDELPL